MRVLKKEARKDGKQEWEAAVDDDVSLFSSFFVPTVLFWLYFCAVGRQIFVESFKNFYNWVLIGVAVSVRIASRNVPFEVFPVV